MDKDGIPIPPRMAHLPLDRRGFPIPSNVFRDSEGVAHFAINDEAIHMRQLFEKRCPICNDKLEPEQYWIVGGPLSAFHSNGAYNDLPMHKECAVYALQVCPWLAARKYNARTDDLRIKHVAKKNKDRMTFVDNTQMPALPKVFVLGRCAEYSFSHPHRIEPRKPWLELEYWKSGVRMSDAKGSAEARAALRMFCLEEMEIKR